MPAPPREPGWRPRPTGILGLAVVLAVVLGIWYLSGGDPGTPTGTDDPGASFVPIESEEGDDAPAGPRSGDVDPETGLAWVEVEDLPDEADDTLALIDAGGPFPYDQDGATFQNREGILPERSVGTYREYTVETPGSPDRGARRIVTGEAEEYFWTEDHYDSFERIAR